MLRCTSLVSILLVTLFWVGPAPFVRLAGDGQSTIQSAERHDNPHYSTDQAGARSRISAKPISFKLGFFRTSAAIAYPHRGERAFSAAPAAISPSFTLDQRELIRRLCRSQHRPSAVPSAWA